MAALIAYRRADGSPLKVLVLDAPDSRIVVEPEAGTCGVSVRVSADHGKAVEVCTPAATLGTAAVGQCTVFAV